LRVKSGKEGVSFRAQENASKEQALLMLLMQILLMLIIRTVKKTQRNQ